VDITPLGSLTGGRIELVITDQGAAVKHAGAMYANVGDFIISGNGDLVVAGGRIRTANDLIVATAGLNMDGGQNGNAQLDAAHDIDIRSGAITIAATEFAAGVSSTDASGVATITQRGNILLGVDGQAASSSTAISASTFHATGGIGIYNQNHALTIDGSTFMANENIFLSSRSVALTTHWSGNISQSSALTSQTGIVGLSAIEGLHLDGARIDGAAGTGIDAGSLAMTVSHSANGSAAAKAQLRSAGPPFLKINSIKRRSSHEARCESYDFCWTGTRVGRLPA